MYGRIVSSIGAAGLLAGILHRAPRTPKLQAVPVILKAETYQGADARGQTFIVATAVDERRLLDGARRRLCAVAFKKLA